MLSLLKGERSTFALLLLLSVNKVVQSRRSINFSSQHKDAADIPGLSHNLTHQNEGEKGQYWVLITDKWHNYKIILLPATKHGTVASR